jgi:cyclase
MLSHRVIPCLLVSQGGLVKTERFHDPKYVGDPINAVRIFNDKEVDELMVLDIDASKEGRGPDFALVEELAGECFMPLCYGGGIRTADEARQLFSLGVEKVCLQSSALRDPAIIREIADRSGEQSVVVSIDVKLDARGQRTAYSAAGIDLPTEDWRELMKRALDNGAGEIVLNSVDRDGMLCGYDLALIAEASPLSTAPVIALGGAGSLADFQAAIEAGASAVAAGAYFVFYGPHRAVLITYPMPDELRSLWTEDPSRSSR